jgi:hypothetical protein
MIEIKDINKLRVPKNHVLVKVIDDTSTMSVGDVTIDIARTKDGEKWSEGEHSIRRGYLVKLPERIFYSQAGTPWKNPTRPKIGNIVYFDYLAGKQACNEGKLITNNGEIYYILPFLSLILHLNDKMDLDTVEMLNGFILAKKCLKTPVSSLEIKQEYYDDRYIIKRAGECNTDYLDEGKVDDDEIQEGCTVIAKFKNYPKLEADFQLRLDGQSYYYFKRETIIGIL